MLLLLLVLPGYISIVMFSTAVPGAPAWATPPDVLQEIFQESINIWWINDALTALNLSFIPHMPSPPVSEAVFNFVLAWALMFLPVILTDGPSNKVEKKVRIVKLIPVLLHPSHSK